MTQKPKSSRKEVFQFRLSKQERQELDRRAKASDVSPSDYVRMIVTGASSTGREAR